MLLSVARVHDAWMPHGAGLLLAALSEIVSRATGLYMAPLWLPEAPKEVKQLVRK